MMILYDSALAVNYLDYGIMLPIPADRGKQVLDFLGACSGLVLDNTAAFARLEKKGLYLQPPAITRKDLERVHSKKYIAELYGKGLTAALLKTFELVDNEGRPCRYEPEQAAKPLTDLFQILVAQAGGSYLACKLALAETTGNAFCYYLGGGMHHARYDTGAGFCLINDVAAAAFKILAEIKSIRLIWIIDLDAHKGDGTAELVRFARERGELRRESCILTLSIHMAKGWPLDEINVSGESLSGRADSAPFLPSDIDIGIDTGEEGSYTPRLAEGIQELERISKGQRPDLVLVVDGADPYEHDELPSGKLLNLSLEQCLERDNYVYHYLKDKNIPSAWILSGGYGERAWEPPAHFLRGIISKNTLY